MNQAKKKMANGGWSMVNSVGCDNSGGEVSEIINQKGPRERDSISDYPVSSKVGSPADNSTLDRLGQLKKAPPAHSLKFIPQCR